MNIRLSNAIEKKEIVDKVLVVNGRTIGECHIGKRYDDRTWYHAVLRGFPGGLVQGHGESVEAAVVDAVSKNRAEAIARLEALEALQMELMTPVISAYSGSLDN